MKMPGKIRLALWTYLVVDLALILLALILGLIVLEVTKLEPAQFGFFCDDESIRYPASDDTFSSDLVVALSFIVPLLLVSQTRGMPGRAKGRLHNCVYRKAHAPVLGHGIRSVNIETNYKRCLCLFSVHYPGGVYSSG